jgi:phage gpG-like protein
MAAHGFTDTDMGLKNIRNEMKKLGSLSIKAGIVEGSGEQDGVSIAEYATYNELGVPAKPGSDKKWRIPPRPFVRGWVENKAENIKTTQKMLVKLVAEGKMDAETAIRRLGELAQDGIKSYIKTGTFTPNSDVTINGSKPNKKGKKFIKGKGSSKPLIDTGTLRNSIRFQIIEKPVAKVSKK